MSSWEEEGKMMRWKDWLRKTVRQSLINHCHRGAQEITQRCDLFSSNQKVFVHSGAQGLCLRTNGQPVSQTEPRVSNPNPAMAGAVLICPPCDFISHREGFRSRASYLPDVVECSVCVYFHNFFLISTVVETIILLFVCFIVNISYFVVL